MTVQKAAQSLLVLLLAALPILPMYLMWVLPMPTGHMAPLAFLHHEQNGWFGGFSILTLSVFLVIILGDWRRRHSVWLAVEAILALAVALAMYTGREPDLLAVAVCALSIAATVLVYWAKYHNELLVNPLVDKLLDVGVDAWARRAGRLLACLPVPGRKLFAVLLVVWCFSMLFFAIPLQSAADKMEWTVWRHTLIALLVFAATLLAITALTVRRYQLGNWRKLTWHLVSAGHGIWAGWVCGFLAWTLIALPAFMAWHELNGEARGMTVLVYCWIVVAAPTSGAILAVPFRLALAGALELLVLLERNTTPTSATASSVDGR